MQRPVRFLSTSLVLAALAGAAIAASHIDPAVEGAMTARNAHMQLYGFNLGPLGAMAQDKMPYDAAVASTAAANLAALAALDQSRYWVEGSDTSVEGSRALPAIWENMADFDAKQQDLATASAALAAAAGTDLEALKAAFGPVGAACGACHQTYRASDG